MPDELPTDQVTREDFFQEIYVAGTPPWDVGRAQGAFVRLAGAGKLAGHIVDLGCGTGENALFLSTQGFEVTGIDFAPTAIERARNKAAERKLNAAFVLGSVLDMSEFTAAFDTAIDSGCFHVFDDDDRAIYVRSVHAALRAGARAFILCFSDLQPGVWGPRRVTQRELRDAFIDGWRVDDISAAQFDGVDGVLAHAWLTSLTRL